MSKAGSRILTSARQARAYAIGEAVERSIVMDHHELSSEGASVDPATRLIKLTVNLSPDTYAALKAMAAQRGVTVTEMLRQAISTAKWVQDTTAQGEKILKQDQHGHLFEVVF